uniref:Tyrosine specific protein phosphatases domain-containing protein n=1 Tax=Arcella intermedia TaxID=1963864 RepID=A0A6B2L3M4_9EUKA
MKEFTPLIAAIKNKNLHVVLILLENPKVNPNQPDESGQSPLFWAVKINSYYNGIHDEVQLLICEALLNKTNPKVNLNYVDPVGHTALMFSVMLQQERVTRLLVDAGSDVNAKNILGITPLHLASSTDDANIVWLLISNGAKQVSSSGGDTPLSLTKNLEITNLLKGKRTSISHPYSISWISKHPLLKETSIGIAMCPGRKSFKWQRNLTLDLEAISQNTVDLVVSIITRVELLEMGLIDLHSKLEQKKIQTLYVSLPSKWTPTNSDEFYTLVDKVRNRITKKKNKKILIHCNAGKGRTGLFCAAILMVLGMPFEKALETLKSVNFNLLKSPYQQSFLKTLSSQFPSKELTNDWILMDPSQINSKKNSKRSFKMRKQAEQDVEDIPLNPIFSGKPIQSTFTIKPQEKSDGRWKGPLELDLIGPLLNQSEDELRVEYLIDDPCSSLSTEYSE